LQPTDSGETTNRGLQITVLCAVILLFAAAAALAQLGYGWEAGSGKTFGRKLELPPGPPSFRMTATGSLNGRSKYDYFLLVKAKLNGVWNISGALQNEKTFNADKIDVWVNDDSNRY
jgi:hypothetical protein